MIKMMFNADKMIENGIHTRKINRQLSAEPTDYLQ